MPCGRRGGSVRSWPPRCWRRAPRSGCLLVFMLTDAWVRFPQGWLAVLFGVVACGHAGPDRAGVPPPGAEPAQPGGDGPARRVRASRAAKRPDQRGPAFLGHAKRGPGLLRSGGGRRGAAGRPAALRGGGQTGDPLAAVLPLHADPARPGRVAARCLGLLVALALVCQLLVPNWGSAASRLMKPWKFVPSVGRVQIVKVDAGRRGNPRRQQPGRSPRRSRTPTAPPTEARCWSPKRAGRKSEAAACVRRRDNTVHYKRHAPVRHQAAYVPAGDRRLADADLLGPGAGEADHRRSGSDAPVSRVPRPGAGAASSSRTPTWRPRSTPSPSCGSGPPRRSPRATSSARARRIAGRVEEDGQSLVVAHDPAQGRGVYRPHGQYAPSTPIPTRGSTISA